MPACDSTQIWNKLKTNEKAITCMKSWVQTPSMKGRDRGNKCVRGDLSPLESGTCKPNRSCNILFSTKLSNFHLLVHSWWEYVKWCGSCYRYLVNLTGHLPFPLDDSSPETLTVRIQFVHIRVHECQELQVKQKHYCNIVHCRETRRNNVQGVIWRPPAWAPR